MSNILEAALGYLDRGWSIIPIKPRDKRPLCSWEEFQKRHPTKEEVREWFQKWPSANIGIVTGKISNLSVIDVDDETGAKLMNEEILSDTWLSPKASTPRGGYHFYCNYCNGIGNNTRAVPGIDLRSEGGYIVAPPSIGDNGKAYQWIIDPEKIPLSDLPEKYVRRIESIYIFFKHEEEQKTVNTLSTTSTNVYKMFDKGTRDQDLFHVANQLARAGSPEQEIRQVLYILAENCNPPFPEQEIEIKIQSVLKRAERKQRPLAQEIREFICLQEGTICLRDVYDCLHVSTREDKKNVSIILRRLADEKLLEKVSGKIGTYRTKDTFSEDLDFLNADTTPFLIKWPMGVHELVSVYQKSLVVIAGEPNAGKTAYLLNAAWKNKDNHNIQYFSSEMGDSELKIRLQKFNYELRDWKKIKFKWKTGNFQDSIDPNGVNIIDYLEIFKDFFEAGGLLTEIYNSLDKGIAIVAIQKPRGRETGIGGERTLDKARLYMAISPGVLKIIKGKLWAAENINPNGMFIKWSLGGGANFRTEGHWQH